MENALNKKSATSEVISFLVAQNLNELVHSFKENDIDGDEFFNLELRDIISIIPKLKLRKKFLATWSEVTKMDFDLNGVKVQVRPSPAPITPVLPESTPRRSPRKHIVRASPTCSSSSFIRTTCADDDDKNYSSTGDDEDELLVEPPARSTPRRSPRKATHTPSPVPEKRQCRGEKDDGSPLNPKASCWLETFSIPERQTIEECVTSPTIPSIKCLQGSKSGKALRKSRQRKSRIQRKKQHRETVKANAMKVLTQKFEDNEHEKQQAKQIANGYYFKWKKTREENETLFNAISSSSKSQLHIPKCLLLERPMVNIQKDKILGEGTFGKCFFGNLRGIEVAVKMFKEKYSNKVHTINEVRVMSNLVPHQNLPMLLGVCLNEEPFLLVTKFIGIGKKSVTVEDFVKGDGTFAMLTNAIQTMEHLVSQILQGLKAIHHSGFLHNDLKTNNVLVERQGSVYSAIVIDFGKACVLHKGIYYNLKNDSAKKSHIQRYKHLAPELVFGEAPQSVYSDIYSVGYLIQRINNCNSLYKSDVLGDISIGCMTKKWKERPGIPYAIDYIRRKSKT